MARPQKDGLDYFPLDVDMDDKVKLIDAKFGVAGFGILIKIWQTIYDNSYYIRWTEKELLLYKNRINADINLINDVVNECIKWDIFNGDLFDAYSILTSSGIQKRYFEATNRRSAISLIKEYLVIPVPENYKPKINYLPVVYVNNNSKNADSNPQSKVKKSKVNNNPPIVPPGIKFAEFVSLTNAEHKALVAKLGSEDRFNRCIEILDNYKGANGKKYKSDYRAILNWVIQRLEEEEQKGPPLRAPTATTSKQALEEWVNREPERDKEFN
jgi:hypothetical protein